MHLKLFYWAVLVSPLLGQQHPYSNAWVYYTTSVTSSLQFTATTVAGTGGTATHTMSQIAVYIQSPGNRQASGYDYPGGTTGQATAYLDLCGSVCEDGNFFVSTVNTNELCGQTHQTLALPVQQGNQGVQSWVTWISATINPSSPPIPRTNGSVSATGNLRKSQSCSGVNSVSMGLTNNPSNLQSSYSPNSSQSANFGSGSTAAVSWTVSTGSGNPTGGTITASFGIENTSCTIINGPVKTVDISVSPYT
jgi:hypothetical protein